MIVCICNNISSNDINDAIRGGARSVSDIQASLSLGSNCGSCKQEAKRMLDNQIVTAVQAQPIYFMDDKNLSFG